MKLVLTFSTLLLFFACENKNTKAKISEEENNKAVKTLLEDEAFDPDLEEEEEFEKKNSSTDFNEKDSLSNHEHHEYVANYYVLITDTGLDYFALRTKMISISTSLNYPIDSLERTYNKTTDLISLPIDDPDPTYAGEYFQRRFPSNNLSLEYVNSYQLNTTEKNIGIVAGIFEKEDDALLFLAKIKTIAPQSFMVKAQVYIGCIH